MLVNLWHNAIWRALLGGCIFVILSAIATLILGQKQKKNGRLYMLIYTAAVIIFAFLGLVAGAFSPTRLGIQIPNWPGDFIIAGIVAIAAIIWLFLLLYPFQPTVRARLTLDHTPLANLALCSICDETSLAIARAALAPLAGFYTAIWLAPLVNMLLSLTDPKTHQQLATPGGRRLALLRWILDWTSSLTLFLIGNVWLALAVRLIIRGAFELAIRIPSLIASQQSVLEEKGENN